MLQQIISQGFEVNPGTVRMPETKDHGRHGHFAFDQRFERFPRTADVSWMQCLEWSLADQGTGGIAQHARSRWRLVLGHSVRVMNGDDVERVLHQRTKPRLAFLQGVGLPAVAGRALEGPKAHGYSPRAR